jgi:hypothetical protein
MNQITQVQDQVVDFEVDAPALEEFAQTAATAVENTPRVAGTGFATCPAKTGQYC